MKTALIALGAVAIFIAVEFVLRLIARRERAHFDSLPLDAQRKYQEDMHKAQTYSNSRSECLTLCRSALLRRQPPAPWRLSVCHGSPKATIVAFGAFVRKV